jgi:osmotically-inducible protein OsmY
MKKEMTMKTDKQLQQDVLDELVFEPSVDAAEIGVSVENGVVILNGTVKTLAEKWTAERVSQRVDGVRAVTDELVVKVAGDDQPTDPDIAQAAVNALDWNTSVPRKQIKVLVENGWITLDGSVEYHFQKDAAESAMRNLKGVKGVHNIIAIKPSAFAGDVTRAIKRALHRAAQVDAEKISVEANAGKVILRGNVRSLVEREEAERAAWSAPGVSNVQNYISIASAARA